MADADFARIKRNISKMIDAGAPEADLDAYVSSEGVTSDQLRSAGNPAAAAARDPSEPIGAMEAMSMEPLATPGQLARSLADGATMGLSDRAIAGVRTMLPGATISYGDAVKEERAKTEAVPAGARVPLQLAGGLATGLGAAKAGLTLAPLMSRAASAGETLGTAASGAKVIAQGGEEVARGLLPRTGLMAAEGAAYGAADKLGHTDKLADAPGAALTGAVEGGVLGGALPVLARGAGEAYRVVTNAFGQPVADLSRRATGLLSTVLDRSGDVRGTMRKLGPDATLAEASPAALGVAEGVVADPTTKGAAQISEFVRERGRESGTRLRGDLNEHLGPLDETVEQTRAGIRATSESRRAPLEAQFDASEMPSSGPLAEQIDALGRQRTMAAGLREASGNASDLGVRTPRVLLDEAGRVVPNDAADRAAEAIRPGVMDAVDQLPGRRRTDALATRDELIGNRRDETRAGYRESVGETVDPASPEGQALAALYPRLDPSDIAAARGIMRRKGLLPAETETAASASPAAPTFRGDRPVALNTFIERQGGIRPTPDLDQIGNKRILRRGGAHIDEMREHAAENGYLPHDSTTADFLDLIERGSRGTPVYRQGEVRAPRIDPGQDEAARAAHKAAKDDVLLAQLRAGKDPASLNMDVADGAAHRVAFEGVDPTHAYAVEAAERAAQAAAPQVDPLVHSGAFWQAIEQAHRGKIRANSDAFGRVDPIGHSYAELNREIGDTANAAFPIRKSTDRAFADNSLPINAADVGTRFLSTPVEELQRAVGPMGGMELEALRNQAANAVRELARTKGNAADSLLGNPALWDRMGVVFPAEDVAAFRASLEGHQRTFTEQVRPSPRELREGFNRGDALTAKAEREVARPGVDQADVERARAMRGGMNTSEDVLAQVDPIFSDAIALRRQYEGVERALDRGGEILKPTGPHPSDLASELGGMSASERVAATRGVRADVDKTVATASNDLRAVRNKLGHGEDKQNRQNARQVFGDEAIDGLLPGVEREELFDRNARILGPGSRTEPRRKGAEMIDGDGPIIKTGDTLFGKGGHFVEDLVRGVGKKISGSASKSVRDELGGVYTKTGDERDAILDQLLEAVSRRKATAGAIEGAGSGSGTLQGILGLDRERRRPLVVNVPGRSGR